MCQRWGPPPQQGNQGGKPPVLGVFIAAALVVALLTMTGAVKNHPAFQAFSKQGGGPAMAGVFGKFLKDSTKMLPKIGGGVVKSSSSKAKARTAARFAMGQRGDRYRWGGNGPHSWDCSGLTQGAWRHAGVKIPGTAKTQLKGLKRVGKPRTGDLIVYRSGASPSGWHVAIAVGQGQMVEARGRRWGVVQGRIRGGWAGVVRP